LEVRTSEGDTVRISLSARQRVSAAVSGGGSAVSGASRVDVRVAVEGSLSDAETKEIGDLLEKLVSSARQDEAPRVSADSVSTLDGYQFAYRAYQRSSEAALLY